MKNAPAGQTLETRTTVSQPPFLLVVGLPVGGSPIHKIQACKFDTGMHQKQTAI